MILSRLLETLALYLRILLWPIRYVVELIFPTGPYDGLSPAVTAKAARAFASKQQRLMLLLQQQQQHQQPGDSTTATGGGATTDRTSTGGNDNDDNWIWSTEGFHASRQRAGNDDALLFVYLHSPLHVGSKDFAERVLAGDSRVVRFLKNPRVRPFGASVHTAQGTQLANLLQATSFPLVALLQLPLSASGSSSNSNSSTTSSSMNLLIRAQGPSLLEWSTDGMAAHLDACLTRHEVQLAENLARRLEREQEAELRRQQDEEYRQALEADREREREVQRRQQEEEDAKNALQRAMDSIPDEPAEGGTMVRFVLPSGTKLNRKFADDEKIGTLKSYLAVYFHEKSIEIGRIGLSTSFPRKTYNDDDDDDVTLQDAGLCPQAVLMVQDLDA